ncbi:MAG: minor capsid protein [Sporolactobacillus sp.]
MAKNVPRTRYPWSAERFYVGQLLNMVSQLGKVTLQVFDDQIKPRIKQYNARQDTAEYMQDAPLDVIRQAIELIKGLSLGIFSSHEVQSTAGRFVKTVNEQSKANAKAQGAVHNVDPTQSEPWLDEFMRSSIAENVSYISTIRDEFFPKIESIIYQGVKKGQSIGDIRQGLVDRIGMTRNRAQFIAVDQTGTIFGQMTAKRHQAMGVDKFEWVDAGDNRVRPLHQHYNGNIYEYAHPPADGLPGEPYRCRCVAYPVFGDDENAVQAKTVGQTFSTIPNYEQANIEGRKVETYILNKNHPKGGPKAEAFDNVLGYNVSNKDQLIQDIHAQLPHTKATFKGDSGFGDKYEDIMDLTGPNGRTAPVLTGWIMENLVPRLTSAYIIEKEKAEKKRGKQDGG